MSRKSETLYVSSDPLLKGHHKGTRGTRRSLIVLQNLLWPWCLLDPCGSLWFPLVPSGSLWRALVPTGFQWFPLAPLDPPGSKWFCVRLRCWFCFLALSLGVLCGPVCWFVGLDPFCLVQFVFKLLLFGWLGLVFYFRLRFRVEVPFVLFRCVGSVGLVSCCSILVFGVVRLVCFLRGSVSWFRLRVRSW